MKRVLVVGGTSGIGEAIVKFPHPYHAMAVSRRTDPSLNLRAGPEALELALDACVAALGGAPDALVISGGIGAYQEPIARHSRSGTLKVLEMQAMDLVRTNLTGPLWLTELVAGRMRERGGSILLVSSTVARRAPPDLGMYAATKAGAERGFLSMARRYAKRGVRLNILQPGWVESPMTAEIAAHKRKKIEEAIPAGRMATPQEVANLAWSILEHPYAVGEVVSLSGGIGL